MMWKLDALVLPVLAVAMLAAHFFTPPLAAIYRDCWRHGLATRNFMLPLEPGLRFCIDPKKVVHYLPPRPLQNGK